jgi:ELWxxDGT repeat protein
MPGSIVGLALLGALSLSGIADHPRAHLVQDLAPGPDDRGPWALVPLGDRVLAVAAEIDRGDFFPSSLELTDHLYRSDGTPPGTVSLLPDDRSVEWIVGAGSDLAFFTTCDAPETADDGFCAFTFKTLWRTDGTLHGTFPLVAPPGAGGPAQEGRLGNSAFWSEELGLFFMPGGSADVPGSTFWVSDGTLEGTRAPAAPRDAFRAVDWWDAFEGKVYFRAEALRDGHGVFTLAWTDGTSAGTVVLDDVLTQPGPRFLESDLGQVWAADGHLFLFFSRGEILDLWSFDGTPGGLRFLAELGEVRVSSFRPAGVGGDRIYFVARDSSVTNVETPDEVLWASDGTVAGTRAFPVPDGAGQRFQSWFQHPVVVGERVYYSLDDGVHGSEPWVSDGTPGGTHLVHDFCPGPCDGSVFGVAYPFLGDVLLSAGGNGPWTYDPASDDLRRLGGFCSGECKASAQVIEETDGRAYLIGFEEAHGAEIWVSDGTAAGTVRLSDFQLENPFLHESFPSFITQTPTTLTSRNLFFGAREPDLGYELWTVALPAPETEDPPPPPGDGLTSTELPGFEVWVRIVPGTGAPIPGRAEAECIPETLCVSGAVPGRSELFVRVVGPKPNGFLWPTLVKFSTSTVEVWIEQRATGIVRYYRLEGASPGSSDLPGLFDRTGFEPE